MGKREIKKIDVCGGQIVNHSLVFSWSRINPCVHRLSWLCYKRLSSPPMPALPCKCLVFNELMLYWLLFEFRSMLLFYSYFDVGVWNETSVVVNIQSPLPNDIYNVKLYCMPWYVDFEARTDMAARPCISNPLKESENLMLAQVALVCSYIIKIRQLWWG